MFIIIVCHPSRSSLQESEMWLMCPCLFAFLTTFVHAIKGDAFCTHLCAMFFLSAGVRNSTLPWSKLTSHDNGGLHDSNQGIRTVLQLAKVSPRDKKVRN